MNKGELNKNANIPLSKKDILRILKGRTKVIVYPELHNYNNIEELLNPYGTCIILYLTKKNYGHWTCLIDHDDRIEFYDPYKDYTPDSELKEINYNFREESNQVRPYLAELLCNSDKEIEYNNYKFQELKDNIKTCGRHCISRILFKNFKLDEYYEILKQLCNEYNLTCDQLVTYITLNNF